jgi:hypothetical protein
MIVAPLKEMENGRLIMIAVVGTGLSVGSQHSVVSLLIIDCIVEVSGMRVSMFAQKLVD